MSVKATIAGTVLALCAAAGISFAPWFDFESGVAESDLPRNILDTLLAAGDAPDTVVMMMSSHLADELIAFASPTERQSLRSIVLKAGQDARAPADEAARQYRDYALRRLGV